MPKDRVTGIRRRKATVYEGSDLTTRVHINEESRVGWILSRANTFAIVKIGIPLFFFSFWFITYFSVPLPMHMFDGEEGSVNIADPRFMIYDTLLAYGTIWEN